MNMRKRGENKISDKRESEGMGRKEGKRQEKTIRKKTG